MKIKITLTHKFLTLFILTFLTFNTFGQNQAGILSEKDFGKWESLGYWGTALSVDGNWLVYSISRNNKDNELRLHDLSKDTVKILKDGEDQVFSGDSKWFGYLISPDSETEEDETARKTFELINLVNGKTTQVKNISSFSFSKDGKFLVLNSAPNEDSDGESNNIIVKNLDTQKDFVFGNVTEHEWSDQSSLLAMVIETEDKTGNGVQIFDGKSITKLVGSKANYSGLNWRNGSDDLAVFRSRETDGFEEPNNNILIWKNTLAGSSTPKEFSFSKMANFPKNMQILNTSLRWSADGNAVFFNIDNWKKTSVNSDAESEGEAELPEIPGLEIWNSRDVRTIPEQKDSANKSEYLSVWHLNTNKFVQIENKLTENVQFQPDSKLLIAFDETPYNFNAMFGRPSYDIYSVNLENGDRKKLLDNIIYVENISPDGNFFTYIKGENYYLYELSTGKSTNLTENLGESFVDLDDDHPVEQKYHYGFVGWDKTGSYFIAHSKFDIWKFDVKTGKGTRLTDGKAEQIMSRYVRLDESKRYIDIDDSVYVYRFGKWSKKSGYAKLVNGTDLQNIYWGDSAVSRLTLAENSDIAAFTIEKYNDSPDFFISKNGSSNIKQISKTNPFENQYKVGKTELIEYVNANGKKLQGILYYPDDYVPGKKYPMITYIYELLSDEFHEYTVPAENSYYNSRIFTSKDYFVLKPDIVFDAGDPGVSSTKTLDIAVKTVVDKGLVDAKKVGLIGHSWGGYQTAFAVTRTNTFAAAVAGAGITNLITMYGTITPSFGGTFESQHFEVSQERMRVPPWEDINGYLRNSAIPNIEKMQTPLLMEVGDADTNVNWGQGIEMYNAARRAKKELVLLVYAEEGHSLRQNKNQIDYRKRILEWFGHYLKDEPAKRWIKDNISYSEQQDLLKKGELED